jgi:hypothetical protein
VADRHEVKRQRPHHRQRAAQAASNPERQARTYGAETDGGELAAVGKGELGGGHFVLFW